MAGYYLWKRYRKPQQNPAITRSHTTSQKPNDGRTQPKATQSCSIGNKPCAAEYFEINQIYTDPARFQNRIDAFSEVSAQNVADNYNPNKFDPIVVWYDPKAQKTFVLSGHSRLEGMKRRGEKQIPVRFFEGSESEAIQFARLDANRATTAENLAEDLRAYKLFKAGDPKKNIKPAKKKDLEQAFKGKINKLEAWSYLDEAGKFLNALRQDDRSLYPYIEQKAQWVGELRKEYGDQFTNIHERDCFNFLYSDKENLKLSKEDFIELVRKRMAYGKERLFPECSDDGCEKIKSLEEKGQHAAIYKQLSNLDKQKREIQERLTTNRTTAKIYTETERDVYRRLGLELDEEIKRLKRDLNLVEREPGLFGIRGTKETITEAELITLATALLGHDNPRQRNPIEFVYDAKFLKEYMKVTGQDLEFLNELIKTWKLYDSQGSLTNSIFEPIKNKGSEYDVRLKAGRFRILAVRTKNNVYVLQKVERRKEHTYKSRR